MNTTNLRIGLVASVLVGLAMIYLIAGGLARWIASHRTWGGASINSIVNTETNGTTVLLFPEWTNSSSAFERLFSTNLFAVYSNGSWFARCDLDGESKPLWVENINYESVDDVRSTFAVNIDWRMKKIEYDSWSNLADAFPSMLGTNTVNTNAATEGEPR